jgi:branched-chain amino acid transport system ATP-binding protein
VKGRGQAILLVDKNLKDLLPLAESCVILEKGASVWHGSAANLAGDAALQDRFLGV